MTAESMTLNFIPRKQKIQKFPLVMSLSLHAFVMATLVLGLNRHATPMLPAVSVELVDGGHSSGHAKGRVSPPARKRPANTDTNSVQQERLLEPSESSPDLRNEAQSFAGRGGGAPGDSGESSGTVLQRYLAQLMRQLDHAKIYPEDSLFRGEEGRVVIEVEVQPDGQVGQSRVIEPSPFQALDHAAIDTIFRVGKFPPLPGEISHSLKFRIPILFELSKG